MQWLTTRLRERDAALASLLASMLPRAVAIIEADDGAEERSYELTLALEQLARLIEEGPAAQPGERHRQRAARAARGDDALSPAPDP